MKEMSERHVSAGCRDSWKGNAHRGKVYRVTFMVTKGCGEENFELINL